MNRSLEDTFASPEQIEARKAAELDVARDRDAWVWMMASANGRRIARQLVASSGVHSRLFSPDAGVMSYHEGRRSIGIEIMERVKMHAPDSFTTLFEDE